MLQYRTEADMKEHRQDEYIFLAFFIIPVIWLALLIAPYSSNGLIHALPSFSTAINHPFDIQWCPQTLKVILISLLLYGIGIMVYLSTRKNYRKTGNQQNGQS